MKNRCEFVQAFCPSHFLHLLFLNERYLCKDMSSSLRIHITLILLKLHSKVIFPYTFLMEIIYSHSFLGFVFPNFWFYSSYVLCFCIRTLSGPRAFIWAIEHSNWSSLRKLWVHIQLLYIKRNYENLCQTIRPLYLAHFLLFFFNKNYFSSVRSSSITIHSTPTLLKLYSNAICPCTVLLGHTLSTILNSHSSPSNEWMLIVSV